MNRSTLMLGPVLLGCSLFLFAGCGEGEDSRIPQRYPLSGLITIDGEPLAGGSITFSSPEDAKIGISAGGSIVDGRYELLATPGAKSVKISCIEEPRKNVFKDIIPSKYNLKSSLVAEVTEGKNQFDFELTTD